MNNANSIGTRKGQIVAYTGSLNVEVPQGNDSKFYITDLVGSERTQNRSCSELFEVIAQHGQEISFSDAALQSEVGRSLIEDTLKRIQICFNAVSSRVVTNVNRMFGSVYGGPLPYDYIAWPLRWSGENRRALTICNSFVASCYQIPRLRCNSLDSGIPNRQAATIIRPLFDIKAEIMKQEFGLEVAGEVGPNELDALLAGAVLLSPTPGADEQRRESEAQSAARQATAMDQTSVARPTQERSEQAREGMDAWTWMPNAQDWDAFGALKDARETVSIREVPLTPFPFSTTSVGAGGAAGGGASSGPAPGGGTVIPTP